MAFINNAKVHQEHCCKLHGCKYGNKNCPVESGELEQLYPCESCAHIDLKPHIRFVLHWARKRRPSNDMRYVDEVTNFFLLSNAHRAMIEYYVNQNQEEKLVNFINGEIGQCFDYLKKEQQYLTEGIV